MEIEKKGKRRRKRTRGEIKNKKVDKVYILIPS